MMSPNSPWVMTPKSYATPYGDVPLHQGLYDEMRAALTARGLAMARLRMVQAQAGARASRFCFEARCSALVAETQTQHAGSLTYRKGDLRKIWVFVMGTNHKVYANHWDGNSWSWKDQMP